MINEAQLYVCKPSNGASAFNPSDFKCLTKKNNSRVVLITTKGEKNYNKFKFHYNDTLLFGRESEGVPKIVHKNSHERLKIPLKKNTRSLNIGMAVAITLSEALKQNSYL